MDPRLRFSVLMLPWLAHGHISPFLELAKKLSNRNFHIFFCSSPINLISVKNTLPAKYSNSIELVELHLPPLQELPPHLHTTNGLPPYLMTTLKKTFDKASPNFVKILKKLNPDMLIYDFLQPWAPALASLQNIPAVEFLTTSAAMNCFLLHASEKGSPDVSFEGIFLRDYEVRKYNMLIKAIDDDAKDMDRYLKCAGSSFKITFIKTFTEIERKYIDRLSYLMGKKIVPVGPLIQDQVQDEKDGQMEIMNWIDKKDNSSVVYVSFGSEYFLTKEELKEMAYGLELSGVNFIWVVRFHQVEKTTIEEALPKGFLERIGNRGMIVKNWAPQLKILGHSSIGGFVSHCGWNSILESLNFGVPIIAVPIHIDQPINAKVVEEIGVGIQVERDENGKYEAKGVAKVIKELVVEKTAESIRRKVKELSSVLKSKGEAEIDIATVELVEICRNRKSNDFFLSV